MKNLPSALLLLSFLVLDSSCVKEDRSMCPCELVLDLSGIAGVESGSLTLNVLSADGILHSAVLNEDELVPGYVVKVPRSGVVVSAYNGQDVNFDPENGFVTESGRDFPQLWLYGKRLNTSCDVCEDSVILYKSFCRMTIHFISDGKPNPFDVDIDCPVSGYYPDGRPRRGWFNVTASPDDSGCCEICVPRQIDDSMGLSVVDEGSVVRRFALGHYIEASGFDWAKPDLEDLDLTVNFSRTSVSFTIRNWEICHEFYVEI